ncbi:hypothetical protein CPB86DRAFT_328608 [Serendipita vermifera]|nr:hypothetical protein CPB86DRAFT_328608 [Serendipita vermifera]
MLNIDSSISRASNVPTIALGHRLYHPQSLQVDAYICLLSNLLSGLFAENQSVRLERMFHCNLCQRTPIDCLQPSYQMAVWLEPMYPWIDAVPVLLRLLREIVANLDGFGPLSNSLVHLQMSPHSFDRLLQYCLVTNKYKLVCSRLLSCPGFIGGLIIQSSDNVVGPLQLALHMIVPLGCD